MTKREGILLRERRLSKGLSRKALAAQLNCTYEAIRLWECGRTDPNARNALKLSRVLDIRLGELGAELPENSNPGIPAAYPADALIRKRRELTIYTDRNQIYLKKNLRSQFRYSIEIFVHPQHDRDLLIREKDEGSLQNVYCSSRVVRDISRAAGTRNNMRFFCIWDEAAVGWRGILLPDLSGSFLWERLAHYEERDQEDTARKEEILSALYRSGWGLVEWEDVDFVYQLAYHMAVCSHSLEKINIWYLVLMYASAMLDEMKALQRRCLRSESRLSLSDPSHKARKNILRRPSMRSEFPDKLFEIQEFILWLNDWEKVLLRWRMQERDLAGSISFGPGLKKMIQDGIEGLQQKACAYYGQDYIRSFFHK